MNTFRPKKYIVAFLITCAIFATAYAASNILSERKIRDIQRTQDKVSIDILSVETQFELLEESTCSKLGTTAILSDELNSLGEKLTYAEEQKGFDDEDVLNLKKYYSLLEIKDFLLMKKVAEKCKTEPISILYFYSNVDDCSDCRRQGYVLTKLIEENPAVRIYTFDKDLDVNALQTLVSLYGIKNTLPALVIDDKTYVGYQSIEDLQNIVPNLIPQAATSTAANGASSTPPSRVQK